MLVRQNEIEKLGNELEAGKVESEIRIDELRDRKAKLEEEISQLEEFQKTLIFNETQRIKELAQSDMENMENTNNQVVETLKNENQRLIELSNTKSNEVMKLYLQIETMRGKHDTEVASLKNDIIELKELISSERVNDHQENELFKTKMANLRHADITSLRNYYENEMGTILQDNAAK